jgi:hypothetical protein
LLGSADRSIPVPMTILQALADETLRRLELAQQIEHPVRAAVSGHQAGEASTPDGLRGRLEGDQSHQEEGERRPGRR